MLNHSARNTLVYFSPVACPDPEGEVLELPRKFVDGLFAFADLWDGEINMLLPRATERTDALDYVRVPRAQLPNKTHLLTNNPAALCAHLASAALALVPLVPQYVQLHDLCAQAQTPIVYDADYTHAIRRQIVYAETRNPLKRWRRIYWLKQREKFFPAHIRAAAGIQFQGTPAYDEYAAFNRSPLLYFDTRMPRAMLATFEQMRARATRLRSGAPLRLIYSGRWNAIKGVDDLPRTAQALQQLNIPFELDIFGGGTLALPLRHMLAAAQLPTVRLRGEYTFSELMQYAANTCDLFICCHRQGDPSTTFNEMMGAGIPLLGYNQSGLRGLVERSGAGQVTRRNDPATLAQHIAALARERETITAMADAAAAFTREIHFEGVMQRRVAHLHAARHGKIFEDAASGARAH